MQLPSVPGYVGRIWNIPVDACNGWIERKRRWPRLVLLPYGCSVPRALEAVQNAGGQDQKPSEDRQSSVCEQRAAVVFLPPQKGVVRLHPSESRSSLHAVDGSFLRGRPSQVLKALPEYKSKMGFG